MSYAGLSKTKELKDRYEQRNWLFLGAPMSMGEYIEEMAKRILDELKETGGCWLMESALSNGTICVWDWNAVLMAYYIRFESLPGFPVKEGAYSTNYRLKPNMKELLTELRGSFAQEPARPKKEAPETARSSGAEQQAALQKLTEQRETVEKQLESLRQEKRCLERQLQELRGQQQKRRRR